MPGTSRPCCCAEASFFFLTDFLCPRPPSPNIYFMHTCTLPAGAQVREGDARAVDIHISEPLHQRPKGKPCCFVGVSFGPFAAAVESSCLGRCGCCCLCGGGGG